MIHQFAQYSLALLRYLNISTISKSKFLSVTTAINDGFQVASIIFCELIADHEKIKWSHFWRSKLDF